MEDYGIELLNPAQFDKLIPLMQDSFGIHVDVEYFKWKFLDNPAGQFIGFVAVSSSGEYAAYYGVIPELFQVDGVPRIIYQSCDTMTHSRHRRKGLFQRLATECYCHLRSQNQLFVIGFGGGQSTPGFLKFGWKKIFDVCYVFRPRILSLLSQTFKNLPGKTRFEMVDVFTYGDLVALKNLSHSNKVTQVFDENFVQWRLANPRRTYEIKCVRDIQTGTMNGYLIYYKDQNKIVLFDWVSQGREAIRFIVRFLDELSIHQNCKGILTVAQLDISFSDGLRTNGFWTNPWNRGPLHEKIPFIFYANESELMQYADRGQWEITPFCHDAI